MKEVVAGDEELHECHTNPTANKDDSDVVINALSLSLKLEKTVPNLFAVLSENHRLSEFNGIYSEFLVLNDARRGIVEAKVTSAKPLDSKILKRLQASIAKSLFVGEGKTLNISNTVSPEILGGLVVEVGDRTVDLSVAGKVAKLNQVLSESV